MSELLIPVIAYELGQRNQQQHHRFMQTNRSKTVTGLGFVHYDPKLQQEDVGKIVVPKPDLPRSAWTNTSQDSPSSVLLQTGGY